VSNAQTNQQQGGHSRLSTVGVFAILALVTFLLRIFYSGNLYQDDGLWFTSAQEILRGKTLYRDIYFDKPPVLPMVYAGLFKLFGSHILTIRLFTIVYSLSVSAILYRMGSWLYCRQIGLLAAAMFTVFSTTFTTGHMQGLNTDFLMVLPYTAGVFCFLRAYDETLDQSMGTRSRLAYGLAAGLLVGIGVQTNPKALFDVFFFALVTALSLWWMKKNRVISKTSTETSLSTFMVGFGPLLAALSGLAIGTILLVILLEKSHALNDYWTDVWDWGARYSRYYPLRNVVASAFEQTGQYFGLNPLLLIGLCYTGVRVTRRRKLLVEAQADTGDTRAELMMCIWFVVSYAGLATGGRFFGHYFFQLIPSLCILGSRSVREILGAASHVSPKRRVVASIVLCLGLVLPIVRFHGRTVELALDWLRGAPPSAAWLHDRLNLEEREAAEAVTDRGNEEQPSYGEGDHDAASYLFVWGYRPEIYFWSGLKPASRFLSSQPLTGVPADVHYFGEDYRPLLDENETAAQRQRLVSDLLSTKPKYIVDELEFFNTDLAMRSYADLEEIMSSYKRLGVAGRFVIYIRRDLTSHYLKRHPPGHSQ
jgi:4-amino-4-deoxy-L-arabinose transferase-like glycosyltransferase